MSELHLPYTNKTAIHVESIENLKVLKTIFKTYEGNFHLHTYSIFFKELQQFLLHGNLVGIRISQKTDEKDFIAYSVLGYYQRNEYRIIPSSVFIKMYGGKDD